LHQSRRIYQGRLLMMQLRRLEIAEQDIAALDQRIAEKLVPRVTQNAGYNLFNLTRASPVVNCQSAFV
jgi:hypothetical protein